MTAIVISRHAIKRVRQRLGVPAKAVRKIVEQAWEHGVDPRRIKTVRGHFIACQEAGGTEARVHNGMVFVFGTGRCVTVFPATARPEELADNAKPARWKAFKADRRRRTRKGRSMTRYQMPCNFH